MAFYTPIDKTSIEQNGGLKQPNTLLRKTVQRGLLSHIHQGVKSIELL